MLVRPRSALIASILLAVACPGLRASALTITTWTFSNAAFNDGGSLAGFATYISNGTWAWDFTTPANIDLGLHYATTNESISINPSGNGSVPNIKFATNDTFHQLSLFTFAVASPNSGSTPPAIFQPEVAATYRLFNTGLQQSKEFGAHGGSRYLISGTLTGAISTYAPPNIDTAQSFYPLSALSTNLVLPQFDGGTLRINSSSSPIDKNIVISALSGVIDLFGNNLSLSNHQLSGPGGLTIADSLHTNASPGGTLILAEVPTYLGPTQINAGAVVQLSSGGNLPPTPLTLYGKLQTNSIAQIVPSLFGTDPTATLDLGSNFVNFTINGSASTTYAGKIVADPSGLAGLTLSGTTSLTLTGPAILPGLINLDAGTTLRFSGSATSKVSFITGPGSLVVDAGVTLTTSNCSILASWIINGTHIIQPGNTISAFSSIDLLAPAIAHSGSAYGGKLDLNNTTLIIQTSTSNKAAQLATLSGALVAGANGGNWAGKGITSATAGADPQHLAVGLFDNAALGLTTVAGRTADASFLIAIVVHRGDANGNGVVDIQDLTLVANNWQNPGTNWATGDLNFDSIVDIQDFTIVANNWQQTSTYKIPTSAFALTPSPESSTFLPVATGLFLLCKRGFSRRRLSCP